LRTSDFDSVYFELLSRQITKITLVVLAIFSILILRLWFLQVLNGPAYRTKSENNRIRLQDIAPFRGLIFDSKGQMMVGNRLSYDLFVIPEDVRDPGDLAATLNRLVGFEPEGITAALVGASRAFPFRPVCIKRDITRDELAIIETHRFNLPGVVIKVAPQRIYIHGSLAAHLFGYLGEIGESELKSGRYPGSKPGDLMGKAGVEWRWQSELSGSRGGEQVEVDASGRQIRVISRKPPDPGANVHLTIDARFQALAEAALKGKKGAVAAIDPNDGRVLALASSPAYDPNMFIGGIDKATWKTISGSEDYPLQNRSLAGQYPPGSTFKIVVALAGLEEGLIHSDDEIFCDGTFTLGTHRYRCWKRYGHGHVALHKAIVESCDVYFYKLGKKLGIDRISSYAKRFGLGHATGFDAGRERPGLIPSREWKLRKCGVPWQAGETISTSIGQSFVLATPLQMAILVSAVFNGGVLYQPQVTERVEKSSSIALYRFTPRIKAGLGIDPAHLEVVKNALTGAVNEPRGTGGRARLEKISVAGKTGTSQVITLENQKALKVDGKIPYKYRDHAWFVAVAPSESPKIAVAVVVEHGGQGSRAAAPIARELIGAYLRGEGLGKHSDIPVAGTSVE